MDRKTYDDSLYKVVSDKKQVQGSGLWCNFKTRRAATNIFTKVYFINDKIYDDIYPTGSRPGRKYGLSKIHKCKSFEDIPPFRPIVSSIGCYNYNLAKYLSSVLRPLICSDYCISDTFTFVAEINKVSTSDKYFVSYDIAYYIYILNSS